MPLPTPLWTRAYLLQWPAPFTDPGPLGFGSWEASGALLSGFMAKEVVVSTIAQSYGLAAKPATDAPLTFGADVRDRANGMTVSGLFVASTQRPK